MSQGNFLPTLRPITNQKVSISSTSAAITNGVGAQTRQVRLECTVRCYFVVDTTPVATVNDTPLDLGGAEYFDITPGQKVAAITDGGTGVLHVTEMSK